MFTGLIQDIGTIRAINSARGDLQFEIETNMDLATVQIGASICCSGCCLSVTEKTANTFKVDVSQETINSTSLGAWSVMTRINLEPSLKLGDEMGGHIVSGHVDTTTKIIDIKKEGDSHRIKIAIPQNFERFIAPKGSVTIDGVSLTVNDVEQTHFGVNIIPHTWHKTTLADRKAGDSVNIEIDMLARYVARMMEVR